MWSHDGSPLQQQRAGFPEKPAGGQPLPGSQAQEGDTQPPPRAASLLEVSPCHTAGLGSLLRARGCLGLCTDDSLPFQVSVNPFRGIPSCPKFWSRGARPPFFPNRAGGWGLVCPPPLPQPWQHPMGEGSLISLPPFFSLFCEMLISVSFSWFTCFWGVWGGLGMRMGVAGGEIWFGTPRS